MRKLRLNSQFSWEKSRFRKGFSQIAAFYDPSKHSLLKHVYLYAHSRDRLGYILAEETTKSLILVDPGDFQATKHNLSMFSAQKPDFSPKMVLTTHFHQDFDDVSARLKREFPEIQVIIGNYGEKQAFSTKKLNEIQPFSVGDLAICLLYTPGHTSDSCTFAVTHVNSDSTKLPVLFTGDTLLLGSCGKACEGNYRELYRSLEKLKAFPNETLVFPSKNNYLNHLLFVKSVDPRNELLNLKLKMAENSQKSQRNLNIPTLLMEEKAMNPYLRCNEKYYQELCGEKEPVKVLMKLQKMQEMLFPERE